MNKYYSLPVVLVLLLFLFVSCKEEDGNRSKNITNPSSLSIVWSTYEWESASGINPSNVANVYDFIGQDHNDGCNYMVAHFTDLGYIPSNESQFMEEIYTVLEEIEIDAGSTETSDTIRALFDQYVAPMTPFVTYPQLVHIYSYDSISAQLKLNLLTNMAINTKDSNINYVINYIKSQEAPIIISGSYNALQKEDVLKYASILRFSLAYWYDIEKGMISEYNNLGIGGSESDTIVAVQGLKSAAAHDANWAKANKAKSDSARAIGASWIVWGFDAVTSGIGWAFHQVGSFFEDLF